LIAALAAMAAPAAAQMRAPDGTGIVHAAADCSRAASKVVGQTGGQLLSASAQTQGGQAVCVITVLVPGSGYRNGRRRSPFPFRNDARHEMTRAGQGPGAGNNDGTNHLRQGSGTACEF
jgi:hypothetical protein